MTRELTVTTWGILAILVLITVVLSPVDYNPDIDRVFAAMRRSRLITGFGEDTERHCDSAPSGTFHVEVCKRKSLAAARLEQTLAAGRVPREPELVVASGKMILRVTDYRRGEPDRARMDQIARVFMAHAPR